LAIALKSSLNNDLSKLAEQHLKICLPQLIQNYIGKHIDLNEPERVCD
jgi:hypothetical protein